MISCDSKDVLTEYSRDGMIMKYFMGFIDDKTRKVIHYEFFPAKFACFPAQALLRCLEKVNFKCAVIHTDNGTDMMAEFDEVCRVCKVYHHHTLPAHPWQNGKIERFNRDI